MSRRLVVALLAVGLGVGAVLGTLGLRRRFVESCEWLRRTGNMRQAMRVGNAMFVIDDACGAMPVAPTDWRPIVDDCRTRSPLLDAMVADHLLPDVDVCDERGQPLMIRATTATTAREVSSAMFPHIEEALRGTNSLWSERVEVATFGSDKKYSGNRGELLVREPEQDNWVQVQDGVMEGTAQTDHQHTPFLARVLWTARICRSRDHDEPR